MSREPFPCPDYEGDAPAIKPEQPSNTSMLNAIHRTRNAFRSINLDPPDITLQRHDEGMRLLGELSNAKMLPNSYRRPVGAVALRPSMATYEWRPDADPPELVTTLTLDLPHAGKLVWVVDAESPEPKAFMEVQVMGIKVRWPAMRLSTKDGDVWY